MAGRLRESFKESLRQARELVGQEMQEKGPLAAMKEDFFSSWRRQKQKLSAPGAPDSAPAPAASDTAPALATSDTASAPATPDMASAPSVSEAGATPASPDAATTQSAERPPEEWRSAWHSAWQESVSSPDAGVTSEAPQKETDAAAPDAAPATLAEAADASTAPIQETAVSEAVEEQHTGAPPPRVAETAPAEPVEVGAAPSPTADDRSVAAPVQPTPGAWSDVPAATAPVESAADRQAPPDHQLPEEPKEKRSGKWQAPWKKLKSRSHTPEPAVASTQATAPSTEQTSPLAEVREEEASTEGPQTEPESMWQSQWQSHWNKTSA